MVPSLGRLLTSAPGRSENAESNVRDSLVAIYRLQAMKNKCHKLQTIRNKNLVSSQFGAALEQTDSDEGIFPHSSWREYLSYPKGIKEGLKSGCNFINESATHPPILLLG